jgi:hypothetical protein
MQQAIERVDDQTQRKLDHLRAAEKYRTGEETGKEPMPDDLVMLGNRRARIVERVTGTLFVVKLEDSDDKRVPKAVLHRFAKPRDQLSTEKPDRITHAGYIAPANQRYSALRRALGVLQWMQDW